jgi:hypothetical protein
VDFSRAWADSLARLPSDRVRGRRALDDIPTELRIPLQHRRDCKPPLSALRRAPERIGAGHAPPRHIALRESQKLRRTNQRMNSMAICIGIAIVDPREASRGNAKI